MKEFLFILCGITLISFGIFAFLSRKIKISGLKVMLLGLGILLFSNSALKEMIQDNGR